jgi:hypothetical protein
MIIDGDVFGWPSPKKKSVAKKKRWRTARGLRPWKIPVNFFQQIDLALEMASSIPWYCTHRIHGAGIYANMTGVYWWHYCYHIYHTCILWGRVFLLDFGWTILYDSTSWPMKICPEDMPTFTCTSPRFAQWSHFFGFNMPSPIIEPHSNLRCASFGSSFVPHFSIMFHIGSPFFWINVFLIFLDILPSGKLAWLLKMTHRNSWFSCYFSSDFP